MVGVIDLLGVTQAGNCGGSPQAAESVSEMTCNYGLAREQLMGLFRNVSRKQSILDAALHPAERAKQQKGHRPTFTSNAHIGCGVDPWNKRAEDLAWTGREYGVPTEIIISIVGAETLFGRNTGSYRVMDALPTLGFDYPPWADLFYKELHEFLLLTREQQVDPLSLTGSHTGAVGLLRLIPSSFRAYTVNFDGDGHINIWNDLTDATSSVTSYFKQHGWIIDEPVVSVAEINDESAESTVTRGVDPTMSPGELRVRGWHTHGAPCDGQKVTAMRPVDGKGIEY